MNGKWYVALTGHSRGFNLIKAPHSYRLHAQCGIMLDIEFTAMQFSSAPYIMQDVPALRDSPIGSVANYSCAFLSLSLPSKGRFLKGVGKHHLLTLFGFLSTISDVLLWTWRASE